MDELLRSVSEHPLLPIGGIILGFCGIALAIIFYLRGRRISEIRFDLSGVSLIEGLSGALEGIEVKYKGTAQERITVSRFVFWNAGTETIRSTDFTDDTLRISCKDSVSVLDHRIVDTNDETNKIEIDDTAAIDNEEISIGIRFDYLDSEDGAVIQIVHDGDERTGFRLAGSLKGNCSIARSKSPAYRLERVFSHIPAGAVLSEVTKASWFGWFGALMYTVIAIAASVAPFVGNSWWFLALAAFGFFGAWTMISYATGQVPTHLQRELGKLPTANKRRHDNT